MAKESLASSRPDVIGQKPILTRRNFITVTGLALVASVVGIQIGNTENTKRVWGVLVGDKDIDCFTPKEKKERKFPFDVIAVPGAGVNISKDGLTRPNDDELMRLEAAAIAYTQGYAEKIVLLGGNVPVSIDPDLRKSWLKMFVEFHSKGEKSITDESIITEHNSFNTASNIEELKKISEENNFSHILAITNLYHKTGFDALACNWEINSKTIPAESIIISDNPSRKEEIIKYYQSGRMAELYSKEFVRLVTILLDPKLKRYSSIKKRYYQLLGLLP